MVVTNSLLISFVEKHLFWFQINLSLPAEQSVENGIMKFDLLKNRSPKPEREALLLITV
jgi:hypothetical protein